MEDLARFLRVLADEARLSMLWLLINRHELCVCDLMEALGVTQSKASRHLATLRHAQLVTSRRVGAWSYYTLRRAEGAFERAQLRLLRAHLARHPAAVQALAALEAWEHEKRADRTCSAQRSRRRRQSRRGVGPGRCP
jgi:ArsR family transcriptional regulator